MTDWSDAKNADQTRHESWQGAVKMLEDFVKEVKELGPDETFTVFGVAKSGDRVSTVCVIIGANLENALWHIAQALEMRERKIARGIKKSLEN